MSENTQSVTHVIFDYGGTLSNHLVATYQVFVELAKLYGKTIHQSFMTECKNMDTIDELLDIFISMLDLGSHKTEIKIMYKTMLSERLQNEGVPMVSGTQKLIRHLTEHNIPMAIASNSDKNMFKYALDKTIGLNPSDFSHFVTGFDDPEVKNNKPAPDIYLVCAKRFSPPLKSLQNCVIFEDSIRGITGAVETGMKTVLINEGKADIPDSIVDKITVIIDSFNNFKPESVGLPPYK